MAVCPRCNANVPDGTERCLVCGYGLPGTVAESEDPKAPEPPEPVKPTGAGGHDTTEPGGVEFPATTERGYPSDADTAYLPAAAEIPAWAPEPERTTVLQAPVGPPPRRRFPLNMLLVAVVAALAIALLVFALVSGSGSGSNSPHSHTSTTVKSHHNVAGTTTTSAPTTTTSTPATSTTLPPTTTTTRPATTTTTSAPTTTTSAPTTTTTSTTTTSTTLPPTTTTTKG